MGLRRKSMTKSTTDQLPRKVAPAHSSNNSRQAKRVKPVPYSVSSAALDALFNLLLSQVPSEPITSEQVTCNKIEEAKEQLGSLESEIISSLFPQTGTPESFESLATPLGMSIKEVRDVADNALRDLRGTRGLPSRPSSVWN